MTYRRSLIIGLILTVASFAFSVWLYPHLPDSMPRRWDAVGNVVAYGPKSEIVFLMPVFAAFTWLLLIVLPRIAPHGFRLDPFLGVFGVVVAGIIAALAFFNVISLLPAAGHTLQITAITFIGIGIFIIFLGNYMGKFRKNFFIGVRTPWTLASDEVWSRTHRLTGRVLVAAGVAIIIDGVLGANVSLFIAIVLAAVLIPFLSSILLYWRIEGFGPDRTT